MTCSCGWWDEFAFLKLNKIVFNAAAYALSRASESAERNGTPHMRIITTTPNALDVPEGCYCYSLIREAVPFDEHWYDMNINTVKKIVKENSSNDFVFIQFDYKQLGHDEAWLEKQKKLVNNDLLNIKREIFLEWTLSADDSPFTEEQLSELNKYVKQPIGSFYINNIYKFNIYEELYNVKARNYVIPIDIAGGLEKDSTVITIIDPLTYKPCVTFRSNKIDTVQLVEVLVQLIEIYFESGVLVPERNNMGLSVIQMLLRTSVSGNIYYETKKKQAEKQVDIKTGRVKKETKETKVYGLDTSSKSREIMYKEILNMVINERPELVNNQDLFDEIKGLAYDKKGKIQAREGLHDDCVMSFLIGMYMLLYGMNVSKFIKVTHRDSFNQEDKLEETSNQRVKRNIEGNLHILNNNESYRNIENLKKQYESMMIDTTNHGETPTKTSSKNIKLKRNIEWLRNL